MLGLFNRGRDEQGFTLVELVVVMVILGILATLGIQAVSPRANEAKKAAADANVRIIASAVELYQVDHGALPDIDADDNWDDFMEILTASSDKGPYLREAIGTGTTPLSEEGESTISGSDDNATYKYNVNTGEISYSLK
jgi:prepilin-type N-terminal cleavage/methylation domain-containing protein